MTKKFVFEISWIFCWVKLCEVSESLFMNFSANYKKPTRSQDPGLQVWSFNMKSDPWAIYSVQCCKAIILFCLFWKLNWSICVRSWSSIQIYWEKGPIRSINNLSICSLHCKLSRPSEHMNFRRIVSSVLKNYADNVFSFCISNTVTWDDNECYGKYSTNTDK